MCCRVLSLSLCPLGDARHIKIGHKNVCMCVRESLAYSWQSHLHSQVNLCFNQQHDSNYKRLLAIVSTCRHLTITSSGHIPYICTLGQQNRHPFSCRYNNYSQTVDFECVLQGQSNSKFVVNRCCMRKSNSFQRCLCRLIEKIHVVSCFIYVVQNKLCGLYGDKAPFPFSFEGERTKKKKIIVDSNPQTAAAQKILIEN